MHTNIMEQCSKFTKEKVLYQLRRLPDRERNFDNVTWQITCRKIIAKKYYCRCSNNNMVDRKTSTAGTLTKRGAGITVSMFLLTIILFNNLCCRFVVCGNGSISTRHTAQCDNKNCHYGPEKSHQMQK